MGVQKNEYYMLQFCVITLIDVSVMISGGLATTRPHNTAIKHTHVVINMQREKQRKAREERWVISTKRQRKL